MLIGIKKIPPIVGVPCLRKCLFGPSSLIICFRLIFFNLGILKKVNTDDMKVVIINGIVRLLFTYFKSKKTQTININPNKINT